MAVRKIEIAVEIPEETETVFCSMIRLGRAVMIWAGLNQNLGSMAMAVPARDGKTALCTALKDPSARGCQLATRLSSRVKLQVLFCGNLDEGQDIMWKCLEARLSEEIACNPDFFAL